MIALLLTLLLGSQCVDYSKDPAGCQPSTFDTPIGQMPSVRVNRQGNIDPFSSEEDARAGAAAVEKELHLFRNFEHLHWVLTVPSVKDAATGKWKGGDLDGEGDGRGLGVAGNCIFTGHGNGPGVRHAINIFKLQPNPEKQPPVQVGEIPAMVEGNQGFDDLQPDWPTPYIFKQPVAVRAGTEISVTAYYENAGAAPRRGGFRLTLSRYRIR